MKDVVKYHIGQKVYSKVDGETPYLIIGIYFCEYGHKYDCLKADGPTYWFNEIALVPEKQFAEK